MGNRMGRVTARTPPGNVCWPVVARLKENLPEFRAAVEKRFSTQPPARAYRDRQDRVEIWDADDFAPWETLPGESVRVIRYRQHQPDGTVVQADGLTHFPTRRGGGLALYHRAKSRWEIQNQGCNDVKNRYGIEPICHPEAHRILVNGLLTFLSLLIERLYRIRDLPRGTPPVQSAEQLCRLLWLGLSRPLAPDTS